MRNWGARVSEERGLLAPCFTAVLLWYASVGHQAEVNRAISFETSFLVLPLVLHRQTRGALPRSVTTSLPVWLDENPLVRANIADRAKRLAPFTKEALLFGGMRRFLVLKGSELISAMDYRNGIANILSDTSDEVRSCAKRSEFLGRWFAKAGEGRTVLALMGIRP